MDKFRNEGMSKPTVDTVRIRQNNKNIKIYKRQGNFTSFKGKGLYNLKKQTIPDWLLVLALLLHLNLIFQVCSSLYCNLRLSACK